MIRSESFRATSFSGAKALLSIVALFLALYIFSSSAKFGLACGFGLYGALLYYQKRPFKTLVCYLAAAVAVERSLYMVYSSAVPAALLYLGAIILRRAKGGLSPLKLFLLSLGVKCATFLNGGSAGEMAGYAVEVFLSSVFMVICVNALKAPLFRGLKNKLSTDETVCVAAMALALYAGLYNIDIFGFKIYPVVAAFSLLASLMVYPLSFALSYGLIIGMAVCLLSGNAAYLGAFAAYALVASVFKDTSKYLAAVSAVLVDLLFAYYFKIYGSAYSYLDLASLAAGCLLFSLVPKRYYDKLAAALGSRSEKQLSRRIINRCRAELTQRLASVGEVFYEMEKVFAGMVKGYMSPEDAVKMLSREAIEEVCSSCAEKKRCHKDFQRIEGGFEAAIKAGIDKGKVTLLEIPPQLASACLKPNALLSVCGRLSGTYRQYAIVISNLDSSRALIGRQFKGVGDILQRLARQTRSSVGFDTKREKVIMDELAYHNISCSEAIVYNENNGEMNISLLVKSSDAYEKNVSKIISGLVGVRMTVCKKEEGRMPELSVLHLKPAPAYDVVFGAAGCAKEGRSVSGDTHSLTRISDERFLLALCDGMGSGEAAERTSSMAISLVENFYRAGFDSETILSAVNRLLNVGSDDNFAALDICAIDLSRGVCDFIKLGSPQGYIKGGTGTEVIESNAPPIGILEEVTPTITTKNVGAGDIIVLVSDGVAGAFGDSDSLREFIFSETTRNPQQLAESILKRALHLCGDSAKDDMTVLTMRVYQQI
jgi:stage II sporulation protein E